MHIWFEQVQPVVDYLHANQYALFTALGVPSILVLLSLLSLLFGGKKVNPFPQAI